MCVYIYTYLFIFTYIYTYIYIYIYIILFVHIDTCMYYNLQHITISYHSVHIHMYCIYLSVCPSVCLSVCLSILYLSIHPSTYVHFWKPIQPTVDITTALIGRKNEFGTVPAIHHSYRVLLSKRRFKTN